MGRYLACLCTLLIGVNVAGADEYAATLIRLADGKITFSRGTGKKKKETTLPTDEKVRVFVAKYNPKLKLLEAGDEVAGGLRNPIFQQLDKEAVEAWIRTNSANDTIVELRLYQSTKKKKS